MTDETINRILEIIIISLLITSAVAVAARRLRIPYTVGLVLIGLLLSALLPPELRVEIPPQVILTLLVPPLVFEAAFHIRFEELNRDLFLILLLAVPGVILTTMLVGGLVAWGTGLTLSVAIVFGALVSATDPVAVVALFRRLGAPHRLQVLLEGESLLNDGTAIVIFNLSVAVVLGGNFNALASLTKFFTVAGGGVLLGTALGMLASFIISNINDHLVETTLTTVLAFGAYMLGESLHVSGVLAVVSAGLVSGNFGPRGMSATTRVVLYSFWDYAAFVANSFVFLLIGLKIDLNTMFADWPAIVTAILAVLLARAVAIYGFSVFGNQIPNRWRHVLYWGGLRGAITLALALSLPIAGVFAEERIHLQAMAFGVVLFTLLVQGSSMDWLVRKLKLVHRSNAQMEYERRHARFMAGRAGREAISQMHRQGLLSEHSWHMILPTLEKRQEVLVESVRAVMVADPGVQAEEIDTARREGLRAQRATLTGLLRDGVVSEEIFAELVGEVDEGLSGIRLVLAEPPTARPRNEESLAQVDVAEAKSKKPASRKSQSKKKTAQRSKGARS